MFKKAIPVDLKPLIDHLRAMPAHQREPYLRHEGATEWGATFEPEPLRSDKLPPAMIEWDMGVQQKFAGSPIPPALSSSGPEPAPRLKLVRNRPTATSQILRDASGCPKQTSDEPSYRFSQAEWNSLILAVLNALSKDPIMPMESEQETTASPVAPDTAQIDTSSQQTSESLPANTIAQPEVQAHAVEASAIADPRQATETVQPQNQTVDLTTLVSSGGQQPRQEPPPPEAGLTPVPPTKTFTRPFPIVPLNRLPELTRQIKQYQELREEYRKIDDILKKQIAKQGGFEDADPHKIRSQQSVAEILREIEQGIKALEFEAKLQVKLNRAVSYWVMYRDIAAIALQHDPGLAKTLTLMPRDVRDLFDRDSTFACFDLNYLASLYRTSEEVQSDIAELERICSGVSEEVSGFLRLIDLRLNALQDILTATLGSEIPQRFETDDSRVSWLPQLIANSPYVDYRTGPDDFLRVTHYPVNTADSDGDLLAVLEIYPPGTLERLRLAIVYDLPWHALPVSLASDPDLRQVIRHLKKLCGAVCKKPNSEPTSLYRFPNSVSFLRLYDETAITLNQTEGPTSLHIPFCFVPEFIDECKGDKSLAANSARLKSISIPTPVFVELFPRMMLGSCWLEETDLRIAHSVIAELITRKVRGRIQRVVHFQMYSRNREPN